MRFRQPLRPRVGIDIAPLVDVVFQLVIFFAVSTTFLETSGLKLELPRSSSTADRELHEIAILMAEDGALVFEGAPIAASELKERLSAELAATDRKIVVLRADARAPHGRVVEVMDLAREAGAEGLTVAARPAR